MPSSTRKSASASNPKNSNLLKLSVREFGPIARADIDIRPLTVLVGRNNTGKTYFSKLVYALHQTLSGFPAIPYMTQTPLPEDHYDSFGIDESIDLFLDEIRNQSKTQCRQRTIRNLIAHSFEFNRPHMNDQILNNIERYFGTTDISTIRRAHSERRNFKIEISHRGILADTWSISIRLRKTKPFVKANLNHDAIEFDSFAYKKLVNPIEHCVCPESSNSQDEFLAWASSDLVNFILKLAYPESGRRQASYFLPANRGGILECHKFIADLISAQDPNLGLEHLPDLRSLPKVSGDFVRAMWMAAGRSGTFTRDRTLNCTPPLEMVAEFIENELIGGKLNVNAPTETAFPVFNYAPSRASRSLKLNATSSMISELAPLAAVTRSCLSPFDLLIIEEPEAHLHPGSLPSVAQCFAKLVRSNVRVIISTQSDWLLKSLRNLILVGDLVNLGDLDGSASTEDHLLRGEVGAWEFSTPDGLNGATVDEIAFDDLDGIEPLEFDRIADSLYNRSVAIRNEKTRRLA